MQPLLILGNQMTLYAGHLPDIGQHRHSASALCLGLDRPIRARMSAQTPWREYRCLFVPADIEHALSFGPGRVAILFFEKESLAYRALCEQYRLATDALCEPEDLDCSWMDDVLACRDYLPEQGEELLRDIRRTLLPAIEVQDEIDPRVRKALAIMQARPDHNFTSEELAAQVYLSASRLSALFVETMGLPLRRYRVWLRLRSILVFLGRGMSLTEAAAMAGFSDSAHFSNTCRKLLGVKPLDVLGAERAPQILFSAHL